MKNSNELEKSRGVVLFASNTHTVDYYSIAKRAEILINYYLKLPVTIIDPAVPSKNKRYNIETGQFEFWHNKGRSLAYDLSPYDQTLLIDSDYLIFDNNLLKILDSLDDYAIAHKNKFIDGTDLSMMDTYSLSTLWATIIAFNKTEKSRLLFEMVKKIERNYTYYWKLYNISASNFRNDFAFTIADNIINGYKQDKKNYIPWSIFTINKAIQKLTLVENNFFLHIKDQASVIPKQNIHVMDKKYLLSDNFENLIRDTTSA